MPQRLKWSLNSDIWLWCENDWTRTLCDSKKGEQVWETPQRLNQNCRTLVSHPASKIAPREISAHKLRLKLFQKTNSKTKWIHTFLDMVLVLFILSQWVVVFRKASIGCYRRHPRSLRAIIEVLLGRHSRSREPKFRGFIDPSDQNKQCHPPFTVKNMRFDW